MSRMIDGFSGVDKVFYEREFTFFDEVTSISGKLKPFIKRPKPEKKQKQSFTKQVLLQKKKQA